MMSNVSENGITDKELKKLKKKGFRYRIKKFFKGM